MALYYYDGNKFQRCLNTDTVSGLTLDKRVEDLALFLEPGGNVNTLLSEHKAMETCFYDIDEVPKLLYILTHRGWELVLTEDMNVRPKGLHTKESISVLVKEVLQVIASETYKMPIKTFNESIHAYDNCVVKVKMVPKAEVIDKFNLTSKTSNESSTTNSLVEISWPSNVSNSCSDTYNLSSVEFNSQNNTESIVINIVPE